MEKSKTNIKIMYLVDHLNKNLTNSCNDEVINKEELIELVEEFLFSTDNYCIPLTSLEGCPKTIKGDFCCFDGKSLTSLEGCPEAVN